MTTRDVGAGQAVNTEDLFRAHASFVARFLTRLGVCPDELDDAVQEVFLVVHRNGGYVPGPATPTGYLASIALRAASTCRRRGRRSRERTSAIAPDDVSSAGLDPARSLEVHQSLAELQGALDGLQPDLRATLVLAELEGETCNSIATTMNIAVGTVYWRLHRARKSFRSAIERRRVAERHAEGLTAGALLFGRPADALLDAARAHPGVSFDVPSALTRLHEALRSGVSIPPWSTWAARVGRASGVGLTAPVVLSAVVFVYAVGTGMSRWSLERATASRSTNGAALASIALELPGETAPATTGLATESASGPSLAGPPADDVAPGAARAGAGMLTAAHRVSGDAVVAAPPARPVSSPQRTIVDPPSVGDSPLAAGSPAATDPLSPDAMREIQEVAEAQRLLTSDPAQAISLVRAGEARFPSGYLREERRYVGVVALFKLGRLDVARAEAARFLTDYPDGPFTARVRAAR